MKKFALALSLLAAHLASAPGSAAAAKKAAKSAPVDVTFQNACTQDLALRLGVTDVKIPAGQTALITVTPEKPGEALPLAAADQTAVEWARLAFTGAGKWEVKVAECSGGKADVFARQSTDPNAGSPQAAAQVHFRARVRGFLEYQAGDMGAFKPLSVAMTSYIDAKPGELAVSLRKRGAAAGPVLANLKKSVPILPGRKQVVEVDFSGAVPFVSVEDEGPAGP
jgi:hypothetical protein